MPACGGCAAAAARRGRSTTAAATREAYKVVDDDGVCLLMTDDLRCRVFADQASAVAAARSQVGSSGWTIQPVLV